jgi:D-glycero-beta-D-manno-heptose 1-phosphate adenylyltransferase
MNFRNKIFNTTDSRCLKQISSWKKKGKKIVFTNGCFDIIHSGHVRYLHEAKKQGDKLIIGLNSDDSVRRLKGLSRPVNSEFSRAEVLAFMGDIDMVVIFEQDTPLEIIKTILPDVLVKGGDWKTEEIVGADIVIKNKGIVKSLTFIEGFSTTSIINKITEK